MNLSQFFILLILIMLINNPVVNEFVVKQLGENKHYSLVLVNVLLALAIYYKFIHNEHEHKHNKESFFMEFGEKPECAKGYSGKDVKFEYTYAGLLNSCEN